jgi:hypothetical protein
MTAIQASGFSTVGGVRRLRFRPTVATLGQTARQTCSASGPRSEPGSFEIFGSGALPAFRAFPASARPGTDGVRTHAPNNSSGSAGTERCRRGRDRRC